ncbi:hypothetical protein [Microlunatus sp. GCM10028923]|uniref:hypothetical protein n=1 Tax=Microlunatus sp. GCM10028923 TaxID=3273400 RepID=UPI0036068D99
MGAPPELSPEEFLKRFGESDGPALARRLLADAVEHEDADDLEGALRVVYTFGVTPDMLDPLKRAATGEWHQRHEDVVFRLQDLGDPGAVDVLWELTERVPGYLDEPEATTLSNNATWALFKIGGHAARDALERVRDSNAEEDRRDLADDLLERMQED